MQPTVQQNSGTYIQVQPEQTYTNDLQRAREWEEEEIPTASTGYRNGNLRTFTHLVFGTNGGEWELNVKCSFRNISDFLEDFRVNVNTAGVF